jgi:TonB family protein
MKSTFCVLFTFIFLSNFVLAQNQSYDSEIITSDSEPTYPGGLIELRKFIATNVQYPMDALEKNLQGKVYVRFKVDNSNGKIDSVWIEKGIPNCPMCDEEAVRVIKMMPNFIPTESEQKYYSMQLPISFVLEGGEEPNSVDDENEITKRYDAHWAGFDIGSLILMSKGFNSTFENNPYWENNIGKSSSVNLNLLEYKLPIVKQYLGLTTGLGLAFSTVGFGDNYLLYHDQDTVFAVKDNLQSYRNNSLTATYLTVPLLLEFSTKAQQKKSFYVAAGVVGGLRIGSYTTKTGKYENGDRFQNVVRSKYNLNPVTLDATLRAGYGWIGLYASYQLNSLFKNNKTVDVFPFKVGVTFNVDFFKKGKSNEDEESTDSK